MWDAVNFTVEPWAKEWLREQRQKGLKCIEIIVSNNKRCVYKFAKYNPTTKPQKTSICSGAFDPQKVCV